MYCCPRADPDTFVRGGPTLKTFLLYYLFYLKMMSGDDLDTTKVGHRLPASETPFNLMAFRWRADVDPTLNAGYGSV